MHKRFINVENEQILNNRCESGTRDEEFRHYEQVRIANQGLHNFCNFAITDQVRNNKYDNDTSLPSYPPTFLPSKSIAFTLAEVLITIAIVGVVSMLLLPPLISAYNKRVIEVGLKKTYSDLMNIIKRSEIDNGPYETWDYSTIDRQSTVFVNKYIAPYIHLTQCKHNGINGPMCFAGMDSAGKGWSTAWLYPGNSITTLLGGAERSSPKYILDDGRSIMIQVHRYVNKSYVNFYIDVNGKRGKSMMGYDVFAFYLLVDNGRPQGLHAGGNAANGGTYARAKQTYGQNEVKNSCKIGGMGTQCGYYLEKNGWEFPKDYPLKI